MKTKKIRVLIIEDNADDYAILLRELNKRDYEIEHKLVENSVDFIHALKDDWDVIISDYSLPSFTGLDALNICQEKNIDIPFIMVSGTVGEDIAVNMMKNGAKDYIMKNSLARLMPAIERELEDHEIRKQRKQAEEALKISEKLYHSLFEQANEGLVLMTTDGKLTQVNPAYAQMHGYTVEEMLAMKPEKFQSMNKGLNSDEVEMYNRILEGETVRIEIYHYHKDGHIFPLSASISTIDIGSKYILVFYQDITERKETEAALAKKMNDLVYFNKISVGRELKMIDLKKEINELLIRIGEKPKYEIF